MKQSNGFSLVELLFAIFILGAALTLVGTLFMAAVQQNESSFADTSGTIICKNAFALAELFIISDYVRTPHFEILADEKHTDRIGLASQHYPIDDPNDPDGNRGFILLGRQLRTDGPVVQHQLVAIAYARRGDGRVTAERLTVRIRAHDADGFKVVANPMQGNKPPFGINSPVVLPDGRIAKIIAVRKNNGAYDGILDRKLKDLEGEDRDVYVVREENEYHFSPALKAVVTNTWLK